MKKIEHEIITIAAATPATAYPFTQNTDVRHKNIKAIGLEVEDETAIPGATLNLLIDGVEIFQSGFEVSRLACGNGVEPNKRFWYLEEPIEVNQKKVSGTLTTGAVGSNVNIYLLCDTSN